ncbi:MAG: S8 family serine peptidase [Bacillota bacterium]
MKKRIVSTGIIVIGLIMLTIIIGSQSLLADNNQRIEIYPKPLVYEREEVKDLNNLWEDRRGRYELRSYNLSNIDLNYDIIKKEFIFNSQTKWPENITDYFDLNKIIGYGKNPGLNIKALHKEGITGEGINVGIIDGRLLVDHKEFKDNIRVYEETFAMEGSAFYHSTPITSILAGDSNGVAPDVGVYYIAYLDNNIDYESGYLELGKAIERLVEINKSLAEDEKISVISISSGWNPNSDNTQKIYEAIEKAKKENIFVISARLFETHDLKFNGLRRDPLNDPDKISSFSYTKLSSYSFDEDDKDILLLPIDGRWMASSTGVEDYVYYSRGAWSMAIPYISGLYALATQVNSGITPEEFWSTAIATGNEVENKGSFALDYKDRNAKIINPAKLIKTISLK